MPCHYTQHGSSHVMSFYTCCSIYAVCRLEEKGNIDYSLSYYKKALTFDPEEETARERVEALTIAMEKKVGNKEGGEKEVEEEEEKKEEEEEEEVVVKNEKRRGELRREKEEESK